MRNLKSLSLFVFFFTLRCERIPIKTHSTENRCYRTRKQTVCRRVLPLIIQPGIVQAGVAKGLSKGKYDELTI